MNFYGVTSFTHCKRDDPKYNVYTHTHNATHIYHEHEYRCVYTTDLKLMLIPVPGIDTNTHRTWNKLTDRDCEKKKEKYPSDKNDTEKTQWISIELEIQSITYKQNFTCMKRKKSYIKILIAIIQPMKWILLCIEPFWYDCKTTVSRWEYIVQL